MKTSDNDNLLLTKKNTVGILIAISKDFSKLIISWLSPIRQDLKPLSTALNFLLLTTDNNCKVCLVANSFKPGSSFSYSLSLDYHQNSFTDA